MNGNTTASIIYVVGPPKMTCTWLEERTVRYRISKHTIPQLNIAKIGVCH